LTPTPRKGGAQARTPASPPSNEVEVEAEVESVTVAGWTLLGHPLFLDALESLSAAVQAEKLKDPKAPPSGNAKLLANLLDLAFRKIPENPGHPAFRHGGSLSKRRQWFRGKTGAGRYRLFYRFDSGLRVIVYAWVNDEGSMRARGSRTDVYAVFSQMLDRGNPPDDWEDLLRIAVDPESLRRLQSLQPDSEDPTPKLDAG